MIKINNLNTLLQRIQAKKIEVQRALQLGLHQGMRQYEDFVISNMLSGRKRANYGLYRQSGNAANSLDVKTIRKGRFIISNLSIAKRAWYLKVHQGLNYNGPIPKRLYMFEKFKTKGRQFINNRLYYNLKRLT